MLRQYRTAAELRVCQQHLQAGSGHLGLPPLPHPPLLLVMTRGSAGVTLASIRGIPGDHGGARCGDSLVPWGPLGRDPHDGLIGTLGEL